jgi:hypothetical protein
MSVDVLLDDAIDAPAERPWWGAVVLGAFVALVICSNIANAVWSAWIDDKPGAVLALSSRNRYLALALGADIGFVPYVVIATLRLSAAFVVCHLIGRAFRHDTYHWFTRYLGVQREAIHSFEHFFQKAQWVVVPFFVGSNLVAVLTGVHGTRPPRLAIMLAVGIAARLTLFWWLANTFEGFLDDTLGVVSRYQWWVLGVSVVLVLVVNVKNYRAGKGT